MYSVQAQSRGDFKFGLAAGYVGSFKYQLKINHHEEMGESGYCEYIDCRSLTWQEKINKKKCVMNLPILYLLHAKNKKNVIFC